VVWTADYLPFGQADVIAPGVENNLRFAGQYYDQETGLHYNYHRYYDPKLGRYLRADPIGLAGGINPYVYVQNNSVNWTDPKGLYGFPLGGFQPINVDGRDMNPNNRLIRRWYATATAVNECVTCIVVCSYPEIASQIGTTTLGKIAFRIAKRKAIKWAMKSLPVVNQLSNAAFTFGIIKCVINCSKR
jgi:RHS repeat-associated protein